MKQPQPEIVTLRRENTGGIEMSFERKVIGIPNPHVMESHEKPLRAEVETLRWHNPESKVKPGEKAQVLLMGGMNTNMTEVHTVAAMFTNFADTIVGVAHPDAPQSKIIPHDSPFNDEKSFVNSGFTILRTIEKLYEEGALDHNSPLTVVGFSTGGAVLTETIAQDIAEAVSKNRDRFIHQGVLLSPGGMLNIGEKEIVKGATNATAYWQEYFDTYMPDAYRPDGTLDTKFIIKTLVTDAISEFRLKDWFVNVWNLAKRFENIIKLGKHWQWNRDWFAALPGHMLVSCVEVLSTIPGDRVKELLAHFHRMWIDQPGWPHFSPKTAAFKRSRENVGYDVTKEARGKIHDTPMVVWFGEQDKAIPPQKFLHPNDELTDDNMMKRIKEAFPNNSENAHVILGKESRSHHLAARSNASILELYLLRYLYPQKMPDVKTVFVGSSQ